jgi:hypothetical protein
MTDYVESTAITATYAGMPLFPVPKEFLLWGDNIYFPTVVKNGTIRLAVGVLSAGEIRVHAGPSITGYPFTVGQTVGLGLHFNFIKDVQT